MITGHTSYKGLTAQQHDTFKEVFTPFLLQQNFSHVFEVGTAGGGLTLFIRDTLPNARILSFDVVYQRWYEDIKKHNVDIQIRNIFSDDIRNITSVAKVVDEQALKFLGETGKKLILCDGGNKIGEFNCLSYYMNTGDFIMAHDYSRTWEYHREVLKDKVWDWCEIEEKYIEKSSAINNLVPHMTDEFQGIVWVCKTKVS
jgi:hypothetical protein